MNFRDHFSGHAPEYAQFRPRYPTELFKWLSKEAPSHEMAWDCATGNGQAALGLAAHFARVIATDASAQQIASAEPNPRIEYRVATAERSGLAAASADLVTVAQAVHWFDMPAFFAEAKRVSKPGAIVAVWAYTLLHAAPDIDAIVNRYYYETTRDFWPPERTIVDAGYRGVDFPFEELKAPKFEISTEWRLDQLLGYLRTWSATKRFIAAQGFDPVESVGQELRKVWSNGPCVVRWPLHMRVGRVPA